MSSQCYSKIFHNQKGEVMTMEINIFRVPESLANKVLSLPKSRLFLTEQVSGNESVLYGISIDSGELEEVFNAYTQMKGSNKDD